MSPMCNKQMFYRMNAMSEWCTDHRKKPSVLRIINYIQEIEKKKAAVRKHVTNL